MPGDAAENSGLRHSTQFTRPSHPRFLLLSLFCIDKLVKFIVFGFILQTALEDSPANGLGIEVSWCYLHIVHNLVDVFELSFNLCYLKAFRCILAKNFPNKFLHMLGLWFLFLLLRDLGSSLSIVVGNCVAILIWLNIYGLSRFWFLGDRRLVIVKKISLLVFLKLG